ncbi:MAG: mechanosensitive ion channel family protein [Desulfobacterales bacterium]|nr:mechanosensitive ion channel family protein [Desulfobacterales bacterium]
MSNQVLAWLERSVYGASVQQWLIAAALAVVVFFAAIVAKRLMIRKLQGGAERRGGEWEGLVSRLFGRIKRLFLLAVALYIGSLAIDLPPAFTGLLSKVVGIIVLIQIGLLGSEGIGFWLNRYRTRKIDTDAGAVTTFAAVAFIGQVLLWGFVLLVALDNMGVDVTALVAGLGVGGIAVALALQNVLGDLFASFSIVLDKPFVIGDFIIVGDLMGTVEHVGLKTTRIRSLSGEQLVFSNTDLLKSRIRNYKRMYERRVVFTLGVVYQTPYDQLEKIPRMIRQIIEGREMVRFDRAHFRDYGAHSLNFEVVYWVLSPDYNIYMDIQQTINLQIYQRFEEEGIEFAYPTQTLYLRKEPDDADKA